MATDAMREKRRAYRHAYYIANREKTLDQCRAYYLANHDDAKAKRRMYKLSLRDAALKFHDGKCLRCGFADPRALQFDHVNGGGAIERETQTNLGQFYRSIAKGLRPDIQLLCANCNCIKRIENDEHGNLRRQKKAVA